MFPQSDNTGVLKRLEGSDMPALPNRSFGNLTRFNFNSSRFFKHIGLFTTKYIKSNRSPLKPLEMVLSEHRSVECAHSMNNAMCGYRSFRDPESGSTGIGLVPGMQIFNFNTSNIFSETRFHFI
jgi:hypothetical protein